MAFTDQTQFFRFFLVLALLLSSTYAIFHRKSETPVLSLSLHHRDSLIKPQDHNLTARTISMLARDSNRLKYINSRLRNGSSDEANYKGLVTALSGEYVVRIGVGTPVNFYYLVLDTGSSVTWLQCLPCKNCYPQSDPIFDPINSSSYDLLSCYSEECDKIPGQTKMCNDYGNCIYKLTYGDGSTSEGEYALETVTFGFFSRIEDVPIGCGNNNPGIWQNFAGIMGLSWSEASFTSQIAATSFSYCLVDPQHFGSGQPVSGYSTLDFNTSVFFDDPNTITVPFERNTVIPEVYFYYLKITAIIVGLDSIVVPSFVYEINKSDGTGGILIDSGTTLTYLDPAVYHSVREAFKKNAPDLKTFEKAYFPSLDNCYEFSDSYDFNVKLPTLSFEFAGGVTLPLPRENYLKEVASSLVFESRTFCFSFQPNPMGRTVSIIGNIQQRRVRVTYDSFKSLIGWTPRSMLK